MLIRALVLTFLAFSAAQVAAQDRWGTYTADSGTYFFGSASDPSRSMSFGCTAPSPQGRPAIETGSHESHTTGPFGVIVGLSDDLFDWNAPGLQNFTLQNVVLYVGQTGYRLPPVQLDELLGTAVTLSMTDPMVQALFAADRLVLDTGQGRAYEVPVAGLPEALDAALRYCTDRWIALGHALPATLSRFAAPGGGGAASHTGVVAGADIRAIAQGHINRQCNGSGTAGPNGIAVGDIDGDGAADILVDWSDVTCAGDWPRPFCGASLCGGDVLLSRFNHVMREGDALLGMSHSLVPLDNGNIGVTSSGNLSMCQSTGPCGFVSYWDGTALNTVKY